MTQQRDRVRDVCAGDAWVLDAAHVVWLDIVLERADLIVGLDLPRWRSFGRLLRRTLLNIVLHRPTCNGNYETWRNAFFSRHSMLAFHGKSFPRKRARMHLWQALPDFPETLLLLFPREVEPWLAALPPARQGT